MSKQQTILGDDADLDYQSACEILFDILARVPRDDALNLLQAGLCLTVTVSVDDQLIPATVANFTTEALAVIRKNKRKLETCEEADDVDDDDAPVRLH